MDTLSVVIDTVEPRNAVDSQTLYCDGRQWDMLASSGVFLDAITRTAMLAPAWAGTAWQGTAAGACARLAKADYTLSTPAAWIDHHVRFSGDTYLHGLNINEVVTTTAALKANQGMVLSWFAYNAGNERWIQLECGWGQPGVSVSLRIWSDGQVEVWKDGVYLGSGSIIDDKVYYPGAAGGYLTYQIGGKTRVLSNQRVDTLLVPCRGRELLVMSTAGGGFNWMFTDLAAGTVNTITPGTAFWWQVPSGQAQVQAAPMRCGTGGYLLSPVYNFRTPPAAGGTADVTILYDACGFGSASVTGRLMDSTGANDFSPDGTVTAARLRLDFSGDGTATPFVYAAWATYPAVTANTAAGTTDITDYLLADAPPRLSVGDGPDGVRMDITTREPEAIETAGATWFRVLGNRPCEARIGTVALVAGRNEAPEWEEAITDEARRLTMTLRDRWKALERFRFIEPVPLDGMTISEAYAYLACLPGYGTASLDIEAGTVQLGDVHAAAQGEWALLPEVGDTAAEWITRIWEEYDRMSIVGWAPGTAGPVFRRVATLGTVAAGTLYQTIEGAYAAGLALGQGTADAWDSAPSRVYHSYVERPLEPECNDVRVTGYDPRTRIPIQAHYSDDASKDPTTAPASRPTNWQGEATPYGLVDPAITTQSLADAVRDQVLVPRLTTARWPAEWTCDLLMHDTGVPFWRGDVVQLEGLGDYRITAFEAEFPLEGGTAAWTRRPARYQGEFLAGSGPQA